MAQGEYHRRWTAQLMTGTIKLSGSRGRRPSRQVDSGNPSTALHQALVCGHCGEADLTSE
jgi:hypothetical protein